MNVTIGCVEKTAAISTALNTAQRDPAAVQLASTPTSVVNRIAQGALH